MIRVLPFMPLVTVDFIIYGQAHFSHLKLSIAWGQLHIDLVMSRSGSPRTAVCAKLGIENKSVMVIEYVKKG